MNKYFLGVRIDNLTKYMAYKEVANFLQNGGQNTIFTPNPEMLVKAYNDRGFKDILNSASLNICDGKGISLLSFGKLQRISGADFMLSVCKIATEKKVSVFLLGGGDYKNVKQTAINLSKMFRELVIADFHEGPQITETEEGNLELESQVNNLILERIRRSGAQIVFVAFGHGKQEKWINKYLKELPNVKIIMGVGGSFDYISEKQKRAPLFLRNLGLEWLWRLINEPQRWKRIYTATVVFPYLYITNLNKE